MMLFLHLRWAAHMAVTGVWPAHFTVHRVILLCVLTVTILVNLLIHYSGATTNIWAHLIYRLSGHS